VPQRVPELFAHLCTSFRVASLCPFSPSLRSSHMARNLPSAPGCLGFAIFPPFRCSFDRLTLYDCRDPSLVSSSTPSAFLLDDGDEIATLSLFPPSLSHLASHRSDPMW